MTKDPRRDARLAAQFRALDAVPMPPGLAPRLWAQVRPAARPLPVLAAVVAALVLVAAAFAVGRISAPPATVASAPPVTAAPVSALSLLGTVRDGNVVSIRIAAAGLSPSSFSLARLRFTDGTELAPDAVVPNGDGSVTVRYVLPASQFAFSRPDGRIELPVGTGVWVQSLDLP